MMCILSAMRRYKALDFKTPWGFALFAVGAVLIFIGIETKKKKHENPSTGKKKVIKTICQVLGILCMIGGLVLDTLISEGFFE